MIKVKKLPNPPKTWNLLIHLKPNFNEYPLDTGIICHETGRVLDVSKIVLGSGLMILTKKNV